MKEDAFERDITKTTDINITSMNSFDWTDCNLIYQL